MSPLQLMDPQGRIEKRAFLVLLLALGVLFVWLLIPVLKAVTLAAILTILFFPVYSWIHRSVKWATLASFFTTNIIFLTLVLPLSLMMIQVIGQVITWVPSLDFENYYALLSTHPLYIEIIKPALDLIQAKVGIQIDLISVLTNFATNVVKYMYGLSPTVLAGTASFIFNFFVMHFTIFFLFLEGPKILKVLYDLSPINTSYEKSLSHEFKNMIDATIYGYLVTALVQSILAGVGFAIAGVPGFLIFASLTFFMSLVPLIGATSVWLPIVIVYLAQGNWGYGLFLLVYGAFVISGIDNFLRPWLMRGKANIHILLIFFSLFGGIHLFGPIGILFGPVITALFLACIRIYRQDFIKH